MSFHDDICFDDWSVSRARSLKPVRTVAPAVAPLTLAELKSQCRVDHVDDDNDLQAFLDAAIDTLDGYSGILGRALVNQTWRKDFPCFFDGMRIPLEPYVSCVITYYDVDNASQTLSTDVYAVATDARGPFVSLKVGQSWPTTYDRIDAVSITFVAGYGAAASGVPARIRNAIRLHGAHLYKYREMDAPSDYTKTDTYTALIKPFVRVY